jgi:hypothetical protein
LIGFELDAWLCLGYASGKQKDASNGGDHCTVRAKRRVAHGYS